MVKNPPAKAGDTGDAGSIPGLGRSPGEGNGNLLQYSCLKKIPQTEEPGGLPSVRLQGVGNVGGTEHRRGEESLGCISSQRHLRICFGQP